MPPHRMSSPRPSHTTYILDSPSISCLLLQFQLLPPSSTAATGESGGLCTRDRKNGDWGTTREAGRLGLLSWRQWSLARVFFFLPISSVHPIKTFLVSRSHYPFPFRLYSPGPSARFSISRLFLFVLSSIQTFRPQCPSLPQPSPQQPLPPLPLSLSQTSTLLTTPTDTPWPPTLRLHGSQASTPSLTRPLVTKSSCAR